MARGRKVSMDSLLAQLMVLIQRIIKTAVEQNRDSVPSTPVKSKRGRPKGSKNGKRGPGRPKGSTNKKKVPGRPKGSKNKPTSSVTQMVMDGIAKLPDALKKQAVDLYRSVVDGTRVASPRKIKKTLIDIQNMDGRRARTARRLLVTPEEQKLIKDMKSHGLAPRVLSAIFHLDPKELTAALSDKVINLTEPEKAPEVKRPRGRPKGSKNKPKTEVTKTEVAKTEVAKTEVAKTKKVTIQKPVTPKVAADPTRPAVITAPAFVTVSTPAPVAAPATVAPESATPAQ